jgi:hypothetical protein
MNIARIEDNLQDLVNNFKLKPHECFIYDLLLAYGQPKASIARLQKGGLNLSKNSGEILWKKKLFFKTVPSTELYNTIDTLKNDLTVLKNSPRFIIVTDYIKLLAIDTKTKDSLDIEINDVINRSDFFLPWIGMEKSQYQSENPADIKAAERMAKLFDQIKKDNPDQTTEQLHGLNVFLSRLLFCFFAEDTGIFSEKQFTNAISSHTQPDGSDLHNYLDNLFKVLNTADRKIINFPKYLLDFPYVNGGLFRDVYPIPKFTRSSRRVLIDNGKLDWAIINPDIFGSMIQAVVDAKQRSGLGMHYTSVPNIMKVIEPLFLNDLREEFLKIEDNSKKMQELINRISQIKIFDPACGSGNFLIIAYKELRKLEIEIMDRIEVVTKQSMLYTSEIKLSNFYGIEIDDFAHEIAKLSLWLAKHQMDMEFEKKFGKHLPPLPLKDAGNIVCANACRIDWEQVCPKSIGDEIYILGNPPYLGASLQNNEQKEDLKLICDKKLFKYKNLDYIAIWFIKSSLYINHSVTIKSAFVTTNSICQGEQAPLLWPYIWNNKQEIFFAYLSFKWINNAKNNAGVTVSIIGVKSKSNCKKQIFDSSTVYKVENINGYLRAGKDIIINKSNNPISKFPPMLRGSGAYDGGCLTLSTMDYLRISKHMNIDRNVKKYIGSQEFINGEMRYCLYINDENLEDALKISEIKDRVEKCKTFRLTCKSKETKALASIPHKIGQDRFLNCSTSIIIPRVSSERREYIPIGFLDKDTIISDSAIAIYDPETWVFAVITSKMHMVWVRTVAGRLKNDFRYSSTLCYNTFPFPDITDEQKKQLEFHVHNVLDAREQHSEKTLAELYNPDKMPKGLRDAHYMLDLAIERCYRNKPFESDEERLEYLFKLYEKMTAKP